MREYKVEPAAEVIQQRLGSKRKAVFILASGPVLFPLVCSVIPLWFHWLQHQADLYYYVSILLVHFLYSLGSMTLFYVYYELKKRACAHFLSAEPVAMIHFLWGSVLLGLAADYGQYYFVMIVILFFFSSFMILYILCLTDGALIDRELAPLFTPKDQETFIFNPDYNDNGYSGVGKCNEIIRETKFGWVSTIFSWLIWIVFPVSIYVFSDVFLEDNVVSSGVVGLLSVMFLVIYFGARKAVLSNLIFYKAIRRREMGYGVDNL